MGACTSSSEVITDPYTGQEKVKNTLGGAPPALRRPQPLNAPIPPVTNQPLRFVSSGGGNALVLLSSNTCNIPESEFIQVTLPSNVYPGDCIRVQAPDGRMNEIIVPQGVFPGDRFLVRFAFEDTPTTWAVPVEASVYPNTIPSYVSPSISTTVGGTFEVTVPPNVFPGSIIHVQTPNGSISEVTVPQGIAPGGRFMVHLASDEVPSPYGNSVAPYVAIAVVPPNQGTTVTTINNNNNTFEPNIYVPAYPSAPLYTSSSTPTSNIYVPSNYSR